MMEGQEFTSDSLKTCSPKLFQCFQADRFLKSRNNINIPDTIPEQSSIELSGHSLKMEEPKTPTNDDFENKENVVYNYSYKSDESSASTIIAVDQSFLAKCEKKLLESSDSDSESFKLANKSMKNENFTELSRKLGLCNETISTPTHVLRKQISILKNEIAESDEFHDLEMRILKEEKNEINNEDLPYEEVIEKYSSLLELYTSLKNEYDEYRKEQEKLQYKTADCLESLCSQIEASDSSLNFSSASFASFNNDIKSSTMMNNISEVEATIVYDATLLDVDPLATTQEKTFKTPMHLPFKSSKKLFPHELSSNKTKHSLDNKQENSIDDSTLQMLALKAADKVKEVEDLEQRLVKVEDLVSALQSENERLTKQYSAENKTLKDNLMKKTEQFEELTRKLFTETISINPALKETLSNASGTELLTVFIETIMESCKSIQDDLVKKFCTEKEDWESKRKFQANKIQELENQIQFLNIEDFQSFENLKKDYDNLKEQFLEAENLISVRNEEIRLLQSHDSNSRKTREEPATTTEAIKKLELQLVTIEGEKKEIEKRYRELEESTRGLKEELNLQKTVIESFEKENENLKASLQQSEEVIKKLEANVENHDISKISNEVEDLRVREIDLRNEVLKIIKEIETVLTDFMPEFYNENSESLLNILKDNIETEYEDVISVFSKTISTCCEKIKEDLNKHFEINKNELLNQIDDLKTRIKELDELKAKSETKIMEITTEKETYRKLTETLEEKLTEVEAEEDQVKMIRKELTSTEEALIKVKSQLICIEGEKVEIESRCSDLEKTNADLQTLISAKEAIIKDLENSIENMKSELTFTKENSERLEESVSESNASLLSLNEEIKEMKSKVNELLAENSTLKSKTNNFNNLLNVMEELFDVGKFVEMSQEEVCKVFDEKIKSNPDFVLFEEVMETLESAFKCQHAKLNTLVCELKDFKNNFNEDLKVLEESKQTINHILSNNTKELSSSKIRDVMEGLPKSKILSVFSSTVSDACKGVEDQMFKMFENEKNDLEEQRNIDLTLIEDLRSKIKDLDEEKNNEIIALQERLVEVESLLNFKTETLKSQEGSLEEVQKNLTLAEETIKNLKDQVKVLENERAENTARCQVLEENISALKSMVNVEKDTANELLELESIKQKIDYENKDLKDRLLRAEELITDLEESLKVTKDEIAMKESEFINEISTLKNEKESLADLPNKIKDLKENRDKLYSIVFDIQTLLNIPDNLKVEVEMDVQVTKKELTERINTLLKYQEENKTILKKEEELNQKLVEQIISLKPELQNSVSNFTIKDLFSMLMEITNENLKLLQNNLAQEHFTEKENWQIEKETQKVTIEELKMQITKEKEAKLAELEEMKKLQENLKERLCEMEKEILDKDDRISKLLSQDADIEMLRKELGFVKEALQELQDQLSGIEVEKKELEIRDTEFQGTFKKFDEENNNLRNTINSFKQENENLKTMLQEYAIEKNLEAETLRNEIELIKNKELLLIDILLKLINDSKNVILTATLNTPIESCEALSEKLRVNIDSQFERFANKFITNYVEAALYLCEQIKEQLCDKFSRERTDYVTQIENFQNQIQSLNEFNCENETKLLEMNLEKVSLENEFKSVKEKLIEAESLEKNFLQMKNDFETAERMIDNLKAQISFLEVDKLDAEQRSLKFEQINCELQTLVDSKREMIKDLENLIESIKKELLDVKQEAEKSKIVASEAAAALDTVNEEVMELKIKTEELQKENDMIRSKEINLGDYVANIEMRCKELEKGSTDKEENLKDLENSLQVIRNELELGKKENEDLKLRAIESAKAFEEANLEISELRNKMEELSEQNSSLRTIENKMSDLLKNAENRSFDLEIANGDLKKIIETKEEEIKNLENKVTNIQNELESVKQEKENFKQDAQESTTLLQVVNEEMVQIKCKMDELSEQNSSLRTVENKMSDLLKNAENRSSNLETANGDLKKVIETKEEEIKNLENQVTNIQNELESVNQEKENFKQDAQESTTLLQVVNEEMVQLKCKMEELLMENKSLKTEENRLADLLNDLENRFSDFERANEDLRKVIEAKDGVIENLETLTAGIRKESETLKQENEYCKQNAQQLADTLSAANEEVSYLKSKIKELLEENNSSKDAENKLSELLKASSELESANEKLRTEIETKEEIIKNLENQISSFKEKFESSKQENEVLKQNAEQLVATLEATNEESARLKDKIEELLEENDFLKSEKRNLSDMLKDFENRSSELQITNGELRKVFEIKDEMIKSLETQITCIRNEMEATEKDHLFLKEKAQELTLRLQEANEEVNQLKNKLEELSEKNLLLKTEETKLSNLLKEMENRTSDLETANGELRKLVNIKEEVIKNLENLNVCIRQELENVKQEGLKSAEDNSMMDISVQTQTASRNKSGRSSDLCARRLDKLEEINHNLTELLTKILTETSFPNIEKLKLCSVRDYPNIKKQVLAHIQAVESKIKDLTADNNKLDEECDSYAQTIKDLQKEAVKVWKANKAKLEALESEMSKAKEEKKAVECEKEELLSKIAKLENDCQKLKSNIKSEGGTTHNCNCGTDLKKMNDLKRTLLIKEQKILELQDAENQNEMYKSQIKYLENAVQRERKKVNEEKEKSKNLQNELNELKNQKAETKKSEDNQILEQLRMGGSVTGGVVQECVDKDKMRKLAKDIGILKELCKARYAEIKRLEAENATLRTLAPKNSNQMDSPIRTRSYKTRSKSLAKDMWKPEADGKENSALL